MLDRLPPEILDTILVLTYPPSPWPDKDDVDKERRQNLRSLSLVSKAVGTRAQLLLWREFVVGHYHSLAAAGRGLNRQKSLAAEVRTVRAYGAAAVLEVFSKRKTCTGTRNLQVARGWLSWKHVRGLPVETVQLRDLELLVPSELKPLNLVRLALVDIKVTSVDIERLLQFELLPRLRVLELGPCRDMWNRPESLPPVGSALARNLDLLLRPHNSYPPSPSLLTAPTTVLTVARLDNHLPGLLRLNPAHLRLLETSPTTPTTAAVLQQLSLHSELSSSLRTLSLPSSLTPPRPADATSRQIAHAALLKTCATRSIDVFWHDEVDGQPVFPKAFLAYAKRLKAEGEAEAANEVTSEATATRSGYVGGQARR